ncbi:MAG: DUF368 domain-containing protein [Oscillospiraceae bacterium]|nr:DUF368 domain-containing protein [Oscillospiraceae bacterium]
MKFIIDLIKGLIIGSGAILPGISSGVICVALGIYEGLLNRIVNFFKSPWLNIKFFTPFVIGGAIGIVLVGKLLLFLFENYNTLTCFCFIGLILGCFPSMLKQAKKAINEGNYKAKNTVSRVAQGVIFPIRNKDTQLSFITVPVLNSCLFF